MRIAKAQLPGLRVGLVRAAVLTLTGLVVGYLALLAAFPWVRESLPPGLAWFGAPHSWLSAAIACVLIALSCWLSFRAHTARSESGAPIGLIGGLTAATVLLGFSSVARCSDEQHQFFFTPLIWTMDLVTGRIDDRELDGKLCPTETPVAFDVARVTALTVIFIGVTSVAVALFKSEVDRLRIRVDRSVTAVVGVDEDAMSMVDAILARLENDSHLVVLEPALDEQRVATLRDAGVRVLSVDLDDPNSLMSLPIWERLERLYLLSADPAANLQRLATVSDRMTRVTTKRRLPLIVRIDDPWQAESWRSRQFGGSESQWVADAVGKYEVTAVRLLDRITAGDHVTRVIVCGTSPLTLALCADLVRRRLERSYINNPEDPPVPTLTIVDLRAEEYRLDHEFHQQQLGLTASSDWLDAVVAVPSVPTITPLVTDADSKTAIIITEAFSSSPDADATLGTRLAFRFPKVPIFVGDPGARTLQESVPIVGRLQTYRLSMDIPEGQAQDAWERAAMLIHQRYAAETDDSNPALAPWAQLDEFYRGSNRRQVRNALWMVEHIANHTWDRFGGFPDAPVATGDNHGPLEMLRLLGFQPEESMAMAQAEYEDWSRYYRAAGWRYGPVRDDKRKIHDQLGGWDSVRSDPASLDRALRSLAATLYSLRELGYRSHPVWDRYRRTGTVTAEQRDTAWSWTTPDGQTLQAGPGDWSVIDHDGQSWSVRGDIFASTYEHLDGNRFRRVGTVLARPARVGEVVDSLEGPTTTTAGDWVLQGENGEEWKVSAQRFARDYEGPIPD